jgi:replicative DNA helicase
MVGEMTNTEHKPLETLNHDEFEHVMAFQSMKNSVYLNSIADYIDKDFFENAIIGKYFEIVKNFYDDYQKLPKLVEVRAHLETKKEVDQFKALIKSWTGDIDQVIDEDHLFKTTEQFLKEKSLTHNVLKVVQGMQVGEIDPAKVLSMFEESCLISLNTDMGFELFKDFDRITDDLARTTSVISTGWEFLDNALGGGYLSDGRAMYVFSGEPNIGKSICLGNVCENIAKQKKNVLLITLEMPEILYGKRISSGITQIELNSFGEYTTKLSKEMKIKQKDYGKIFIKEFPPSTVTPSQISAFVKKVIESGEKIDAIVVDYLNLVKSTMGNNSYERIKYVCEQLRAISYTFSVPIITATQLNKDGYGTKKGNPSLEHLSESSGTAATADAIMTLFQNEEDMELGVIRMGVIKNRFGPRGFVQAMRMHYATLTMVQMDSEGEYDMAYGSSDDGGITDANILDRSKDILAKLDIFNS